jgi:ADP-ribose pyrophosphatase
MIEKWKIIDRKVYQHSPYRAIEDVTFEMPTGEERVFSLKREGHVVAVLAIDKNNDVILTRQYRPGPDIILDELPGGGVNENESSLDAMKRELREETGYESENWIEIGSPLECAYSTISRHAFLAINCVKTSDLSLDEAEYIQVVLKSLDEFLKQLKLGHCTDPEVGWMGLLELGYLKTT